MQVYVGMRNWRPYIPDVVRQMRSDGVEEAAVICLAPQNSRTSVGLYRRAVQAEAGALRTDFTERMGPSIRCWPRRLPNGCGRSRRKIECRDGAVGSGAVYRAQRADPHGTAPPAQ